MTRQPRRAPMAALARGRDRLNAGASQLGDWARRRAGLGTVAAMWRRLLDEVCDLLAPTLSAMLDVPRIVAVPRADSGFDLYRVTRSGAVPLDMPAPGAERVRGSVEMRLRDDQVFERGLTLPAASRDFLATIIDHRLDRLTPWRRDRVVYGYAISGEGADGSTLHVRVAVAPADLVQRLLQSLRDVGLEPTLTGTGAGRPAEPPPIRLGQDRDAGRPAWQGRFGRVWLGVTAASCGLAAASLVWAAIADDRRVDAERHLVKARRLIREASAPGKASADPVFDGKRPDTATVVLIDKLATTLPDGTYLRELSLTPGEVRLAGTSADAPALIPLLEKAGLFDVRFTAPVSRGDDRKDAFEITAGRAPAPAEAP